jgi:PAS domain S-box-containing protein
LDAVMKSELEKANSHSESKLPVAEIEELRARLAEAEDTLDAIRTGSVDALVVSGPQGEQVYTLRGADHTYRRLVEEMSEGATVLTTDGDVVYSNRCFVQLVGLRMERVVGGPLHQFFSEKDRPALQALLEKVLRDNNAISKQEFTLKTPRGKSVPVYLSATCLAADGITTICLIMTDLTEQKRAQEMAAASMKRLEEEQLKANKLESLGILAGGLAHDLNNSLTAVLSNISLAKRAVRSDAETVRRLGEAEMACLQARDVTQQLLTFSRGGAPVKEIASIVQLLQDWASFALSGSNVHYKIAAAPGVHPVEIDKGQMSRVINNLLINAQQAMPEGGTVSIHATNVTIDPHSHEPALPLDEGDYVRIDIQDRGMGIPESHMARIFDPYFTTKQKGSGLGLSIAYSVVKSHNGYISVDSQIGTGTTFHIYLPASSKALSQSPTREEPLASGKLRVLVMEDQEAIREVIRLILEEPDEHDVEFAGDGQQAIELYQEAMKEGLPFDVVLMDLTIPGRMGGKEAIAKLLEIDPNARAIIVSGYSNDPVMSRYRDYGFKGVIRKPFEIDEFLDTLQAVVAAAE